MGLHQEAGNLKTYHKPDEDLAILSLDERGMIRDCNKAAEKLSGYLRGELVWRHVSMLLPQFAESNLLQEGRLNPRLSFLCHCGHLFHLQDSKGCSLHSELHLVELDNSGRRTLRLLVRPVDHIEQ